MIKRNAIAALSLSAATQGQTYDWFGLVGSQVFNRGINNKGAAFCSEWIAQAGGVPNPELYNPGTAAGGR